MALVLSPAMAAAQTLGATGGEVTLRGTVQAVDQAARTVTILGDKGIVVTLDVPTTATRFDQVKVGDIVTVTYYDRVNARLKPAGEAAVDRIIEPTTTASPGALPGASRVRAHEATVTVTAWNPATRVVTFTGPKGQTYTRYVMETIDPAVVAGLKVGARADVTWTEAVTLQVTPGTAAAAPDSLRHRLTFSFQVGLDNQFSGKMVKAASGTTTGGQPINLDETTFDEVYGRIGLLKIGVGYRTSPRTEAVLNWVWSKSDPQEAAIRVGTVGTNPQVPLDVNFTEYQVLGFRGRPAVVLRPYPLHTLPGLSRRHQSAPGHPGNVCWRASSIYARARSTGR